MKKLMALLGGLTLLGSVHAEVLRYDFTATIDRLQELAPGEYPGNSVLTSTKAGVSYSIGDTIHGHFEYDTATGLSGYQPPPGSAGSFTTLYQDADAHNMLTATTSAGVTLPAPDSPVLLQVNNATSGGYYSDYFSASNIHYSSTSMQFFSVLFMDYDGGWLNSSAIPSASLLSTASYAMFTSDYYFFDNSGSLSLMATINSMTPTSAVPEPSGYLILLAGLAIVTYVHRRRKTA